MASQGTAGEVISLSRDDDTLRNKIAREAEANVDGGRSALLKALYPDAFVDGRIDWEKVRKLAGDSVDGWPERYSFTWPGKRQALGLMQAPVQSTLIPAPDESINFKTTQHLFLEGDNLAALKMLKKDYVGQVKMIYIDPPYNTRGDFVYVDNFADSVDNYLKLTGQKDGEGKLLSRDPEIDGRYHAAWLSMMLPLLSLARELLREDGAIFVSIDDHELYHLRMLMNEVFGEECFKNCIILPRGAKSVQAQFETVDSLAVGHEYVVMYAKSPAARFKKLQIPLASAKGGAWNNHWRGTNRPTMRYELFGISPSSGQWRWSRERSFRAIQAYQRMCDELGGESQVVTQQQIDQWYRRESYRTGKRVDLLRLSAVGKPEHYVPPKKTKLGSDLWVDLSSGGSAELKAILGCKAFDNPKPRELIKRMLTFVTGPHSGDIVLDFFAGSATTAQAVLEANREDGGNRRFILIQLPEPLDHPEFLTIAEVGKERLRRVIAGLENESKKRRVAKRSLVAEDLGFKVLKLGEPIAGLTLA